MMSISFHNAKSEIASLTQIRTPEKISDGKGVVLCTFSVKNTLT